MLVLHVQEHVHGFTCVQYMKCTHMVYQSYIITMDTYRAPYVRVALKHDQEHVQDFIIWQIYAVFYVSARISGQRSVYILLRNNTSSPKFWLNRLFIAR